MADDKKPYLGIGDEYYAALGKFVVSYAHLENTIKSLLWFYAGIEDEEAGMAITGGMRVSDVIATIKRLVVARKQDQQRYDDLEKHFSLITEVTEFRDICVHRQWDTREGRVVITNWASAKSSDLLHTEFVQVEQLENAAEACMFHALALIRHTFPEDFVRRNMGSLKEGLTFPWFEKPLGPAAHRQAPGQASRSPKRPPDPSRG